MSTVRINFKKEDTLIPRRPSNQSKMRVEKFGKFWYAIGGGICAIGQSRQNAEDSWNSAMKSRIKVGYKYRD